MLNNKPLISIGLPAFKGRFLKQAINSVLNQTYQNFELIIINDASPENINDIVNIFNDTRIKYFENIKNIGKTFPTENWNLCLEKAIGEYFILFSDDDLYELTFLEEMVNLASKHPLIDIFHCRLRIINEFNDTLSLSPACPEFEDIIDFVWHRIFGYRIQMAPEFMCRTNVLKKIEGFYKLPSAWGSDDITWFLVGEKNGVAYVNKALCYWRKSDINISNLSSIEYKLNALNLYANWLKKWIIAHKSKFEMNYGDPFLLIEKYIKKQHDFEIANYYSKYNYFKIFFCFIIKNEIKFNTFLKSIYYRYQYLNANPNYNFYGY
jgi:glycosyltransferase involved in cell wall biosynthesis